MGYKYGLNPSGKPPDPWFVTKNRQRVVVGPMWDNPMVPDAQDHWIRPDGKLGVFADALPAAFYGATIVTARGSKSTTVATALGVNNYPASFKWKFLFQVRTPPGGSQKPTEGELLAGAVYHVHIELPKQKGYSDEDLEKKTEGLDVRAEMEGKPYIAGKGA